MNAVSIFNFTAITITLGILAFFICQLFNSNNCDDDGVSSASINYNVNVSKNTQPLPSPITPEITETKSPQNTSENFKNNKNNKKDEHVINYEPIVIRQEFPMTPMNAPPNPPMNAPPNPPMNAPMSSLPPKVYTQAPMMTSANPMIQGPGMTEYGGMTQAPTNTQSTIPMTPINPPMMY